MYRKFLNVDNGLDPQEFQDVQTKLDGLKQALSKILVNLKPIERKTEYKTGEKREGLVNLALDAAKNFTGYLPGNFDVPHFEAAEKQRGELKNLRMQVNEINELLEDTIVAIGILSANYSLDVYHFIKFAAKRDAGVDDVLKRFRVYFPATNNKGKNATITPAAEGEKLQSKEEETTSGDMVQEPEE